MLLAALRSSSSGRARKPACLIRAGCASCSLLPSRLVGAASRGAVIATSGTSFVNGSRTVPPEPTTPRRLRDYFPTPHTFQQALRDDIDAAVAREEWFSCRMTALEEDFEGYYRDAFDAILDAFRAASKVRY